MSAKAGEKLTKCNNIISHPTFEHNETLVRTFI